MAYTPFVPDKPVITDTGGDVVDATRENLMALRDAIVAGVLAGFNFSASGGTAAYPTTMLYSKGVERIRATVTWGSSGGALNNPQVVVYAYSANSGGLYDTIGTLTMTYDVDGNLTSSTWS